MTVDRLALMAAANGNLRRAWDVCLKTDEFRMVVADLLLRCSHMQPTADPETRVRQQLAIEFLRAGGLFDETKPSFGYEYVTLLSKTRADNEAERGLETPVRPSLWSRVFQRKP